MTASQERTLVKTLLMTLLKKVCCKQNKKPQTIQFKPEEISGNLFIPIIVLIRMSDPDPNHQTSSARVSEKGTLFSLVNMMRKRYHPWQQGFVTLFSDFRSLSLSFKFGPIFSSENSFTRAHKPKSSPIAAESALAAKTRQIEGVVVEFYYCQKIFIFDFRSESRSGISRSPP